MNNDKLEYAISCLLEAVDHLNSIDDIRIQGEFNHMITMRDQFRYTKREVERALDSLEGLSGRL